MWWPAFFDDDCKAARVSASGSHDGLMRPPVGLRNRWLSKEGLKGAVVIVVVFGFLRWLRLAVVVGLLIKPYYLKAHFEIKIYK